MAGRTQSEAEICRRLWWCLFIMDRRLAIETGRPFLIQDLNLDTSLPQELHDDYFHYHQADLNCSHGSALQTEIPTGAVTPIPYLTAMVTYSRVLGKVWEGIYSAKNTETPPSPHLCEHLEHLISRAQKDIPPEFIYNPWQRQAQPKPSVWWLARQQTLMRVRWLSLRLLIRRPMLQETSSFLTNQLAGVENELISVQIARELIKECLEIPMEQAVFTYPFLHYLISATIVLIALIIKEPTYKDPYGDVTLDVIEVLEAYCHRTQTENQQAGDSTKTSSERLHEPVQNDVVDSQNPGPSDAAPPYAQFAGLTNLEADFYFEENVTRRATPSQPFAHVEVPSTQQPLPREQGVTADSEGDIYCRSLGDSASRAPTGRQSNIADPGEGVAREMQWLEALFGSYLDSDLIIRPGE
ncbi:hypothetical protein N7449_003144 [Penicillium cf. viridicatum]|uniref:Xylanolytic transcriptional activator regulatory domain-containing protein n=1 Tax=Penicillium cf. viridicatum TaxID=2972119 RepID=A0A9W9MWC3_9EURO|nr:hypothetical protein N7449_003144 [Penicillium cf. viridicatum]